VELPTSRLEISKASVKNVLDFLPYPFLLAETVNGVVVNSYLNKRFIEEIGYELKEIPGIQDWFEKAYPDPKYRLFIQTSWMDMVNEAAAVGKDYVIAKARICTKTNGYKWFEVKSSLFGEGQHFVSFVNIDDVVNKEEQLTQANENKNRMLSILSHDLRSSMINLYSLANLAGNQDLTLDEFVMLASRVKEKSARTIELLDTTVQWTRNNFDNVNLRLEDVDMASIIGDILAMDDTYLLKKITIKQHFKTSIQPVTDRGILTIIIRNLLSNAIKFTPPGGRVEVKSRLEDNAFFISVKDSGVGMAPELVKALVNDQYSSSMGTMREKGSGVGLTLCRDLLKKINGRLNIKTASGQGTEMIVQLSL
jgi:signal transduction histidine kinase